jgi:hypothetical protein
VIKHGDIVPCCGACQDKIFLFSRPAASSHAAAERVVPSRDKACLVSTVDVLKSQTNTVEVLCGFSTFMRLPCRAGKNMLAIVEKFVFLLARQLAQ